MRRRGAQFLQRGVHPRVRVARDAHHAPEETLRIYVRDGGRRGACPRRRRRCRSAVLSCPVLRPDGRPLKLLLEGSEPRVVEGRVAALEALPGAGVGGALLDSEVDVADGDGMLFFVVEDGLEGGLDLGFDVSGYAFFCVAVRLRAGVGMVWGSGELTTTPPMSKRMALRGGLAAMVGP